MFSSHFSPKVVKALARKGIHVIGITAVPGKSGTFLDSQTAYVLNDNGTQRIRSFFEVLALVK